jgi:hypothetical protein
MTEHNKSTNIKICLVAPQAKGHNSTKQIRTMLIGTPDEILWKGLESDQWI